AGAFQRGAIEQDRDGRLRRRTRPPNPSPQGGGGRRGNAGGRMPVAEAGKGVWGEIGEQSSFGTPTLNPSPQGGGRRWSRTRRVCCWPPLPSPLRGGVGGGGVCKQVHRGKECVGIVGAAGGEQGMQPCPVVRVDGGAVA